jgi:predicted aconitase
MVDLLNQSTVNEIDLSGIDQLTDEAFLIIRDVFSQKSDAAKAVVRFVCIGCPHITDDGILEVAQTFPELEQACIPFI